MRRAIQAAFMIALLASTEAYAQSATLLQKFGDWSAFSAAGSSKLCFAMAQPNSQKPPKLKRGPAYFYVSRWPSDNVADEVSVKMGYGSKPDGTATVTIGGEKFTLFTKDEGAYVEKPDIESKLVALMRKGGKMEIQGKSSRGTAITDEYSLDGFGDALDRAAKDCGS